MEAKHTPEAIFRIGRHLKRAVLRVVDSTEVVIFPKGSEDLAKEYCDLKNSLAGLTTEQIEELKVWLKAQSTTLMFDYVAKNRLLEAENVKLNSKIEEYKTMESLHKSSSHMINVLKKENLNLQAELNAAKQDKAEIWEEGYNEGMFREQNMQLKTNPYKEEREPPTWEAPDAWDGGFADNH